jgi:hypothetical protein
MMAYSEEQVSSGITPHSFRFLGMQSSKFLHEQISSR